MKHIYGTELNEDVTMLALNIEQVKELAQLKHPDCFVQCLKGGSSNLMTVEVLDKKLEELIAVYPVKIA